jgi:hypothetical protein
MIRLAFAIGFLSVFGIVSYGLIVLITNTINRTPGKTNKEEVEKTNNEVENN